MHCELNEVALAEKIFMAEPGDCPYTLFLGAGASVSSGILSASGMVKKWQELLYKEQAACREQSNNVVVQPPSTAVLDDWIKSTFPVWFEKQDKSPGDTPYSVLFSHFFQEPKERQMFIEREIEAKKPAFGYLYLAGLIAASRFNRILTTNFDDLIADALTRYYDIKPMVCAFDSAVAGIRIASRRPKIIKLHGDFLFDNVRNVKHELKRLDVNMEEKMQEMCKNSGLVVIGYGGQDESIMGPIRDMLRTTEYLDMGLHWCVMDDDKEQSKSLDELLPNKVKDLLNTYGERVYIYRIRNFDYLMETIFHRCGCSLPETLCEPHKNNLPKQFFESVISGSSAILTSSMTEYLHQFVSNAREKTDKSEYDVMLADIAWQRGSQARECNEPLSIIRKHFSEGYDLAIPIAKAEQGRVLLRIKAWRRLSGLSIGLAKVSHAQENREWEKWLDEALDCIAKGVELLGQNPGLSISETLVRTFYFNACCAISLKARFQGSLSDQDQKRLLDYADLIKQMDPEGKHFEKLCRDKDVSFVAETLGCPKSSDEDDDEDD